MRSIHRPRRVGGGCRSGRTQASGWTSGGSSSGNSTRKASCRGTRRSAKGSSLPQNRGRRCRHNQTRKGYKAHGVGRRPGCTSGSSHCPSAPGGSHAHRVDARASSRTVIRPWPPADEAATAHLRQGGRQRCAAVAAEETADRADVSASIESETPRTLGWPFATPLPSPLDDRKNHGLARQLSATRRPL